MTLSLGAAGVLCHVIGDPDYCDQEAKAHGWMASAYVQSTLHGCLYIGRGSLPKHHYKELCW